MSDLVPQLNDYHEVKEIIRKGIREQIDFAELRKRLPNWRKRPIVTQVFDVMNEMGIKNVPFAGMITRPRLSRKNLNISESGDISVKELLDEKGFNAEDCIVRPHIGDQKITLTIKLKK